MPTPLTDAELDAFLSSHPDWHLEGRALARTYEAPAFIRGIEFVGQVARLAEAADHHPDIDIRWRKVTLRYLTHDAGDRVTGIDTRLAHECDLVFASMA